MYLGKHQFVIFFFSYTEMYTELVILGINIDNCCESENVMFHLTVIMSTAMDFSYIKLNWITKSQKLYFWLFVCIS